MRPWTILTCLRISSTLGETPRSCTLASVPVEIRGMGAMSTASAVTKGPLGPRAMPGASCITFTASKATPLVISDVAPPRTIRALSGEPDETSVALKPLARESMATKTPTVPAIPTTATIAEAQRALTLRMLYTMGMAMSDPPQRVHDAHAHGADAGKQTAGGADKKRETQAKQQHGFRQQQRRQQASECSANHRNG